MPQVSKAWHMRNDEKVSVVGVNCSRSWRLGHNIGERSRSQIIYSLVGDDNECNYYLLEGFGNKSGLIRFLLQKKKKPLWLPSGKEWAEAEAIAVAQARRDIDLDRESAECKDVTDFEIYFYGSTNKTFTRYQGEKSNYTRLLDTLFLAWITRNIIQSMSSDDEF